MGDPTPQQLEQARALLEAGDSIRAVAEATGLLKGRVEKLRHEIEVERRVKGLEPLPRNKPGRVGLVDLGVKVTREEAQRLEERAHLAGLELDEYVKRLLLGSGSADPG